MGPLTGIRVLEAAFLIQGPQAAALLRDMGADVIKIELPGIGDPCRYIPLSADDLRSATFVACNRGKRSLALDLRQEKGAGAFRRLVEGADIVISNFTPGTLDGWGLGYEDLAAINPRIIWAAGSTFGPVGPDSGRGGADLAGQAAGGLISTTGRDGDPPTPVGAFIADHVGSLNLVAGVLAALHERERSGRGQRVEVSLLGGQIWAQATEYTHYLLSGKPPGRANLGHPILHGIYGLFETSDGWFGIVGVPPESRDAFFLAMDCPELSLDERLQGHRPPPPEVLDEAKAKLRAAFRKRTNAEWSAILGEAGVRYAEVRDYDGAAADPGIWENGYLAEAAGDDGVTRKVVGNPIRMSRTPLNPAAVAPEIGEHSEEVLRESGFTEEEIGELLAP